jgi:hypothetical protein
MKRSKEEIDKAVRKFFPWSLFLGLAVVFALATFIARAHGEEDVWACYGSGRYQAMSSGWPQCNEMSRLCLRVRDYLNSHTVEEGRAEAKAKHIPQWLINKAEKCIP